jgi:hypothetical protein
MGKHVVFWKGLVEVLTNLGESFEQVLIGEMFCICNKLYWNCRVSLRKGEVRVRMCLLELWKLA